MVDKGKMDQAKGKAKEAIGKVTGSDRMKAEGKTDQAKGKAKEAMGEVQERARGARDSLQDKRDRT
ncbi:CsbD family protein [Streptomyces sp. NPDC090036]|uniref:CsbD family protein n=1 Tax=Streptomyces sp. NPDC090036 TaxID=3365926 RepID=UPI0037FF20AC